MNAQDLAEALEGRKEGCEWRCHCPVHGGRSLSLTKKDGKILVTCRAGCSQSEVISELKRLGLWGNDTSHENHSPVPEPEDGKEKRIRKAEQMWEGSRPITPGDAVYAYLKNRGITLPEYPEDLRTHPHLDYWEVDDNGKPVRMGVFPCMLAVVRSPNGRPVALHRTYLTETGHKAAVPAPKKILKVHDLTGGAVRLFPPRDDLIAVCEGIEDALSAWVLWQIPTWAVLGTSGMKTFRSPEEILGLTILADNDEPGKKAALELAQRLEGKGKAVRIRIPGGHAKDINQLLTMESAK